MVVARSESINPNKVAIYVRWSTDDQGDGTTLDVQLEGCKHYLKSQGWNVNTELIFVDDGYSGGNLLRPSMTKLREAINSGLIDCVVVFKLDRLSRSVIDTVNLVLDEWDNITYLKSAREPIDTTTPMGKQFFYILTSFAEWERSVIKERTFGGKMQRAKEGKNPGFKAPYGYNTGSTPGTFEVVPNEAEIVKRIFADYLKGRGMNGLAFDLNSEGIKFRKDKPWNDSTISHILSNEIYVGKLIYGKLSINHKRLKRGEEEPFWLKNDEYLDIDSKEIVPIIDPKDYEAVQRLRKARNVHKDGIPGRSVSSPHLLSGLLKCKCGHSLTGYGKRAGNNFAYYKCRGNTTKGKFYCNAGYIRQDIVDNAVIQAVKRKFLSTSGQQEVTDILMNQYLTEIQRLERAIRGLEGQFIKLDAQLKNIDIDYRNGDLSANRYEKLSNQIEKDRTEISESILKFKSELQDYQSKTIDPSEIKGFADSLHQWEWLSINEQKNLLRHWIASIVVYKEPSKKAKDVYVEIVYRWQHEILPEMQRTVG